MPVALFDDAMVAPTHGGVARAVLASLAWKVLVATFLLASPATASDEALPPYAYHRVGSWADLACGTRTGTVLMGGGKDVAEAFQWLCELGGGGDFLLIRTEGTDAYNPYVSGLCPNGNSVATLVVPDVRAAFHPDVVAILDQAELLWIASGDQSTYLGQWSGTPVQRALRAAIERGVPVGGTSAGLSVLTQFIYPAESRHGVTSGQALADPYHERITLARDFVSIPSLAGTLGDSHFRARDRMGRDIALLCRVGRDGWSERPRAIAVDEDTALLVDARGGAAVVGTGAAYLLEAPGEAEICQPGTPVTYQDIAVYRIDVAGSFDLPAWQGRDGAAYHVSAQAGVLTSTQQGDDLY